MTNLGIKCQFPGCPAAAVAGDGEVYYCGPHYNNHQRQKCMMMGCRHPIPAADPTPRRE